VKSVEPPGAFLSTQEFSPDRFQIDAVAAFERGDSVVVTAPTGSGKTLIAEAAIDGIIRRGLRAFYTTPIKALSNQKFGELIERHGRDQVGLLTGDNTINGDAPVVVMTTEVLRNMIYSESPAIGRLGVVILDEVHYLQDRYRGSVWEEIIIHLPRRIPLVCLSATIANSEEFTDWIRSRRGPTSLIEEDHRPVPLESVYMVRDRFHDNAVEIYPIFGRHGKKPNPTVVKLLRSGRGRRRRMSTPRRLEVAEALNREALLPAIYFIFSRAGCDQAAASVAAAPLALTSADERSQIGIIVERRVEHVSPEDLAVLGYESWRTALERGVAAHHAGMVPAFKETVEELFAAGLVKLVFATETLALGINMPARSVVLEQLSKFTGENHELLRAGDYTQLTGRAGRRGIDVLGTAVVLYSSYVPFDKVADIAAAGSHPLVSSFQPTYNMAVNLIANYPRERAEELLQASFAQFRGESRRRDLEGRIAAKERDLATFRDTARCERGDVWAFIAAGGQRTGQAEALRVFARGTHPGDVLDLGEGERSVLLVRGYGQSPRLLLLSSAGRTKRFRPEDLGPNPVRLGDLELPEPFRPRDPQYQRAVAAILHSWEPSEVPEAALDGAVETDPVGSCPELPDHLRWARRAARTESEIRRLQKRVTRRTDDLVGRFTATLSVLEGWKYLDDWSLTERGERLRFVYNELDLLLTESIGRGFLVGLEAPALAALVSVFTYEERPRDVLERLPSEAVAERVDQIAALWEVLADLEQARGVPTSRPPDPGFAGTVEAWASGMDLEELVGDDDFAAGDFVRNCRQLLDLLRQLRDAFPGIAETAAAAVRGVDRGIVAVGGRL
jgi:ATP-dependent RNA helicase HelY